MKTLQRALILSVLAACGGGEKDDVDTTNSPVGENGASFDVTGTWIGAAIDEDTTIEVTLVLANNGGTYGLDLAGELTLDGIGAFPFSGGFIDVMPTAGRVSEISASDSEGFLYTLRGIFTSARMDDGQLSSTDPEVDVDTIFLETTLEKQ